jgi:hypothetical protein
MIGQAVKLARLGLAEQVAPPSWALKPAAQCFRNDIFKII